MQVLSTLPEHLSSAQVLSGVRVAQPLVSCVVFCRSLFVLLFIILWPLLFVLLRFTDSDYPFGIFKLLFFSIIRYTSREGDDPIHRLIDYNIIFYLYKSLNEMSAIK